ncbi:ABC transporter permease [Novipirellula artificiosorum]|uniref:ABC transporter permease n=1 Tax=Novipirellula artificiosorum TaxID=2528016 RepID=UPI001E513BA8|nr:ABC transporter permease [Novipirellula artificiosorum]
MTLFALASAIASVVALLGIARTFQDSFAEVYRSHGVDVVVSRQGAADRLSSSIDESLAEQIIHVEGVARTSAVLLETLSLENEGIYGIPAMGMQPDSWLMENYRFSQRSDDGTQSASSTKINGRLWLGIHLADRLGVAAGQTIELFDQAYRVQDIFTSRSTWENGSMIVPLDLLQELTGRENQVTYVNVQLDADLGDASMDRVLANIKAVDAKLLPLATEDFVATDTRMQIASAMAWMTSMIAVLIGAIGTLNTMMTSVIERTGEIGILRAIGWSRRRIVAMIMGESFMLAVIASVLGCVAAMLLTWGLSRSPAVRGIMDASIHPMVMVHGILIGLGIGLFGALLPAWRAAKLLPTQAFREH